MSKIKKIDRDARSGKFVVAPGKKTGGGERWHIVDKAGRVAKTVITTGSSGAAMDEISARYSKVLKNLAKK